MYGRLNRRLRNLPVVKDTQERHMYYRTFRKGLTGWGKWTGDDHVALLQQMPYVVGTSGAPGDGLIRTENPAPRLAFIRACFQCMTLYLVAKMRNPSEIHINRSHEMAKKLGSSLRIAISELQEKDDPPGLARPKLHAPLHYRYALFYCKLCDRCGLYI